MRVLLLYPPREHHFEGTNPHLHMVAAASCFPPLGLLYVAAHLEQHSSHEVVALDAHASGLSHRATAEALCRIKPDVLGLYVSTHHLRDAARVARAAKAASPEMVVVAGGPHPTLFPRETVALPGVDHAVVGDGERAFTALVNALDQRRGRPDPIPGVVSRGVSPALPCERQSADLLDALPYPARHLLNPRVYRSVFAVHNPITSLVTSRGCPHGCYFCTHLEGGRSVRYRSAANVVGELSHIEDQLGIRDVFFFDEIFTGRREHALGICHGIMARGLSVRWICRSRPDRIDEALVRQMARAGCRQIQFGIETGSPRLQRAINKNLDLDQVRRTLALVRRHGISTYGDFIVGLPGETEAETRQTIAFAKSLELDDAAFYRFYPAPGSRFYQQGMDEGRFTDFWRAFALDPTTEPGDCSWSGSDGDRHRRLLGQAMMEFYLRPGFLVQRLLKARSWEQLELQVLTGLRACRALLSGRRGRTSAQTAPD